jgi:hypothetical protein
MAFGRAERRFERQMMRYRKLLVSAALALAYMAGIRIAWYYARLPESSCVISSGLSASSSDHAFEATILEKDCNQGKSLFYSVRVDAKSPPLPRGWFVQGYGLENDAYPTVPRLHWVSPRRLEIEVETRMLSGELTLNAGDDLTVVRKYVAAQPDARPNF